MPAADIGLRLTDAQIDAVLTIVEGVLPGAEVWVFGSRATGRARPFSDLDLLLTRPSSLTWAQKAALQSAFEASELPFLVDVVPADELTGGIAERVDAERRRLTRRVRPAPG